MSHVSLRLMQQPQIPSESPMLQVFLSYCADCQGKISTCFRLTDQATQAGKRSTQEVFAQEEH